MPTRPALRLVLTLLVMLGLLLGWVYWADGRQFELAEGVTLRSPRWKGLLAFAPKGPTAADSALQHLLATHVGDTTAEADTAVLPPQPRRLPNVVATDTAGLDSAMRIHNPSDSTGAHALDAFFAALAAVEAGDSAHGGTQTVRIAHYGDSQIEGDRITQFIRRAMQRRFGGSGIGWLQLSEPATHHAINRVVSTNWRRYTVFQNRSAEPFYGMGGTMFRYAAPPRDTAAALPGSILAMRRSFIPQDSLQGKQRQDSTRKRKLAPVMPVGPKGTATLGIVRLEPTKYLRWQRMTLLWGRSQAPHRLTLSQRDSIRWRDSLPATSQFTRTHLTGWQTGEKMELRWEGPSPEVYGLLLDGAPPGVAVDNFGLRGHSGNWLKKIDDAFLAHQVQTLNTRLIIFQYGGNLVPYEVKDFGWFERDLVQMLRRYKRLCPNAGILVVGVGDMARKDGEAYHSYPTVVQIRDAQRRAAARAGVAFWDLYAVMGGEDAMVRWVNHDPPLAASDYAHLSHPGQRLVGELLCKALLREYAGYLSRQRAQAPKPTLQASTN